MKKILVMVLAGVMSMSVLAGCGKSEEEKAMEEIGNHLKSEAAADGVDLEAEMQAEAEKYQAELDAGNANLNSIAEKRQYLTENETPKVDNAYEDYLSNEDATQVEELAGIFNENMENYLKVAADYTETEKEAIQLLATGNSTPLEITKEQMTFRKTYLENCIETGTSILATSDDKEDYFIVHMIPNETGMNSQMEIIRKDSSISKIDLSAVIKNDTMSVDFDNTDGKTVTLFVMDDHFSQYTVSLEDGTISELTEDLTEYYSLYEMCGVLDFNEKFRY